MLVEQSASGRDTDAPLGGNTGLPTQCHVWARLQESPQPQVVEDTPVSASGPENSKGGHAHIGSSSHPRDRHLFDAISDQEWLQSSFCIDREACFPQVQVPY